MKSELPPKVRGMNAMLADVMSRFELQPVQAKPSCPSAPQGPWPKWNPGDNDEISRLFLDDLVDQVEIRHCHEIDEEYVATGRVEVDLDYMHGFALPAIVDAELRSHEKHIVDNGDGPYHREYQEFHIRFSLSAIKPGPNGTLAVYEVEEL